jgi:hypothetical protein
MSPGSFRVYSGTGDIGWLLAAYSCTAVRSRSDRFPRSVRVWPGGDGRPQQDSNLRSRLRRPLLSPLSYGGCATPKRTSRKGRPDPSRGCHVIPRARACFTRCAPGCGSSPSRTRVSPVPLSPPVRRPSGSARPVPAAGCWSMAPKTGPAARSQEHHGPLLHHRTRPHHRTAVIAGRQVPPTADPGGPFLHRRRGHVALAGAITARERLPSRE